STSSRWRGKTRLRLSLFVPPLPDKLHLANADRPASRQAGFPAPLPRRSLPAGAQQDAPLCQPTRLNFLVGCHLTRNRHGTTSSQVFAVATIRYLKRGTCSNVSQRGLR